MKTTIIEVITKNMGQPFWEIRYMNFIKAFIEFMDYSGIETDEEDVEEGEREEFIENGVKKLRSVLKLKNEQLVVVIKAHQDGQWLFEFEDVIDTTKQKPVHVKKVEKERILTINGVDCVLLITEIASEDTTVYAIPVDVAEALMIADYDGEEVSRDEDFLYQISQYALIPYFVYNYD